MVLLMFCDNANNVMSESFLENLFIICSKKHNQKSPFSKHLLMCSLDYDIFIL